MQPFDQPFIVGFWSLYADLSIKITILSNLFVLSLNDFLLLPTNLKRSPSLQIP